MLQKELQHQPHKEPGITTYSYENFCWHYQVAYLDYVRYLVGAMWGSVTPNSCNRLAQDLNQGMHKRSAMHLAYMVTKGDVLLRKFEERLLNKPDFERQTGLSFSHQI